MRTAPRVITVDGEKQIELRDGLFIPSDPRQHVICLALLTKAVPILYGEKHHQSSEGMTVFTAFFRREPTEK